MYRSSSSQTRTPFDGGPDSRRASIQSAAAPTVNGSGSAAKNLRTADSYMTAHLSGGLSCDAPR